MSDEFPLLSDPILSREELAELSGLPLDEIAEAWDDEG